MNIPAQMFLVDQEFSVKQAMKRLTEIGQKAVFIVDDNNILKGSLSDGDIRKWILAGGDLREKVTKICNLKPRFVHHDYDLEQVKRLMLALLIECVPVVTAKNEVIRILTWEEVFTKKTPKKKQGLDIEVVIMAGGRGTRLDPFTRILPKPLIPIGDKPIIEIIMDKFSEHRINKFFVSVNHKSRMIKSYFEESNNKYDIHYLEEKKPLGTVGSLRLLKGKIKEPFIVTNCDIIIEADCAEIVEFHKKNRHDLTLVVSCRHYIIPYGVCEIENGGILKRIDEKPEYDLLVNTGMYVMNKKAIELIPHQRHFNINDLINKAKKNKFKVGVFPISEDSWIDIGQWEEYRKALEKMKID